MSEITLISCVSTKKDDTLPAKELYDSSYFEAMKRYAEARNAPYAILSAKHGLVDPEQQMDPYNEKGLSVEQSEEIAAELSARGIDTVWITAGKAYTDPLLPELELEGMDVIEVCRGLRIGSRISKLQKKTRELES